ncbi:hypothetical protein BGZ49_002774 [Haplosporangium sp. Z 27]|nr:hypothetical protein BGZ49_002774 [Haplosporangium sp. Z 27]
MEEDMTDQDEFFASVDASNHVYLRSILFMSDPLHQMRNEHKDLEHQWKRLRNCKESLVEPQSVDTFLNKYDILEYGFDDNFVERYNLSVVVHDIFMPELDLEKCRRGLKGYFKMFQEQFEGNIGTSSVDAEGLWRVAKQLITVIMALYIRQGMDMSSFRLKELMRMTWSDEEKNAPYPILMQAEAIRFIEIIAPRAAGDDSRLYGLYQDTLKLIQVQLQARMYSIDEPSNMELVEHQMSTRCFDKSNYDHNTLGRLDTTWHKNPEILIEMESHESRDLRGDITGAHSRPKNLEQTAIMNTLDEVTKSNGEPSNPNVVDSIPFSEENNDSEGDTEVQRWLDSVHKPKENSPNSMDLDNSRVSTEQGALYYNAKKKNNNLMEETKRQKDNTLRSVQHQRSSVPNPALVNTIQSRTPNKTPAGLMGRVKNAIEVKLVDKESSDSEFEDDGYVPPLELKRKRLDNPTAALVPTPENGEGPGHTSRQTSIPWSSPAASSQSISPRPIVKVRRRNRAWTPAEVDRLMELAVKFQHKLSATETRPRKVHWSQLKKYDETHGNILEHRTEVMIKDKYREKTDNGHHRQHIAESQRIKSLSIPRHQFPSNTHALD